MSETNSPRLLLVALVEWALVLPATVLLAAAALRQLQPRLYEPSRTSCAGLLFAGLPGLVAVAGCFALLGTWREDETLRSDAKALAGILRRQKLLGLLLGATVIAGAILAFVATHVITD